MQPARKAHTMLQIEIPLLTHLFGKFCWSCTFSLLLGALWRSGAPVHGAARTQCSESALRPEH